MSGRSPIDAFDPREALHLPRDGRANEESFDELWTAIEIASEETNEPPRLAFEESERKDGEYGENECGEQESTAIPA